jgi:ribosomal-protein-alanine N-acetyltransferase
VTPCLNQIDAIMAVMESAFDPVYGEAWNRRQISDALALPSTHALVIDAQGNLFNGGSQHSAGFVLTRYGADEEELLLIAVRPECRRSGLGQVLLENLFWNARNRGVRRIFLEMRRGNPAIHLYQKAGFEPVGKRSNYYRLADGREIDAITFSCVI